MASLFSDYLAKRLPLVESALAGATASPLTESSIADDLRSYLYRPLGNFTSSGGKRVRPVLALLGAESVGGDVHDALSSAVAVELFQSAALIYDDVADESELRRGEPCLYRTEGTGLAINAGALALTQVVEIIVNDQRLDPERKVRVLSEISRMERHTLEGQALDLGWVRDGRWEVTPEDYTYMVCSKTAWYTVASPLCLGVLAAGGQQAAADGLSSLGLTAGIAFQVQDDLLNLVGDAEAQGKDFRSDITEGKRTLAVVWALTNLEEEEHDELVDLLDAHITDEDGKARAVELIELGGGIEHCRTLAREHTDEAKRAAVALANDGLITVEARDLLCSMADFFVERAS